MGWFEEQINYRRKKDDECFSDAMDSIAGAVMGKKLSNALEDKTLTKNALEDVLKYYHFTPKLEEIPSNIDSADEQIDYFIRPHGLMRRRVSLDKKWYKQAYGAMIGTLKESGKLVALIPSRASGYSFFDVDRQKKVKVNKKTVALLDEEAICFYQPLPYKSLKIIDLLKYIFGQIKTSDYVAYIIMMVVMTLLGMLVPQLTKYLFDDVLASNDHGVLIAMGTFMICYSFSNVMFTIYQMMINKTIVTKQNAAVSAALMNRVMEMPTTFFKDYSSGELNQRIEYTKQLCEILFSSLFATSIKSLFSLIYIGQVFAYAPCLVVPSIVITLTSLALSIVTTFVQMKITKEKMQYSSKTSGMTYATVTGIQKIKLSGSEKRVFAKWAKMFSKAIEKEYNPPMFIKANAAINIAVTAVGTIIMYYLAAKNSVTPADYFAFNSCYGMVAGAFTSLASITLTVANIKPVLDMAKPILENVPEYREDKEIITKIRGEIMVNNLSFAYEEDTKVIDNLSLHIKPGEYVAIVGATGCGKSTLLRLLLGFEKPQKGTIYYDKKDISKIEMSSFRRKIGTVLQDGRLFAGDIYSNIAIAAPLLTLDEAWEAARIASIDADIERMPMGMFTMISEGQGGVSGGQKQRLMIARAVANKPKILFFDEATSALDNITQKKVSDAIDKLNCTRVIIAHRLSTIKNCDRIIVMDKGRIVEEGNYDSLIAQNNLFARLVERQRLD